MSTSLGDIHGRLTGLVTDDRLHQVRTWLSPPDPSSNFNNARLQHHIGTGQWFLEDDSYARWKTQRNSFLWLHGIPGCGKTILSSSIVADLQSVPTRSLVYFYFDFNDVEKQSLAKAIPSLLFQLYAQRTDLRGEVDALYSVCNNGSRQPDSALLSRTFQNMVGQAWELWILLDALDECPTRNDGLLPWIRALRDAGLNIHLLVTSRPEQDIQAAIESWAPEDQTITLRSNLVEQDINVYVKARMKAIDRWQSRPGIQARIETTLVQKAGGM